MSEAEGGAVGFGELEGAVGCSGQGPSAFVDEVMVVVAEQGEVLEGGHTLVAVPPADVVGPAVAGGLVAGVGEWVCSEASPLMSQSFRRGM